jgi:PAS domain S-box-containing protein
MSTPLRVLILEDQPSDAELMLHELRQAGFEPDSQVVETAADYLGQLGEDLHVILSDYAMPRFSALEALHLLLDRGLDVPFIVVTGAVSEEVAVECIRQGADDYVLKDRIARLGEAVRNALREKRLRDEKRRAEEALQESEERYRIVSELTSDFAYGYRVEPDGDLVHLWVTGALRRLTGLAADELRARGGWEALVHPDDVPISLSQLRALLAGQAKVVEYRIVTHGGGVRWVRNYARPEWGKEQGRTIAVYGAVQDVTERKEAEERLHRYARRLQTLHEVDRAILAAQSPEDIAKATLSYIRDLVPCISASVAEFDWEAGQATVHAVNVGGETGPRAGRRVPLEVFGIAEALRRGQANVVDDIRVLPERTPADEALLAEGVRSYVNLPLFAQEELLGSLNLGAAEPAAFGQEQIEIAREVADQLALAVLQARLTEAEQQRTAELVAALGKVATRLQTGLDPNQVMETLGTELGRLDVTCVIAMLDPVTQALVVQYHSLDPETLVTAERLVGLTLHGFRIPRERFPIYDELVERRQAVFVPDLVPMGLALMPPSVPPFTAECAFGLLHVTDDVQTIWLPLTIENRMLGCLCLWGKDLGEIDVPTFSMFAGQVAITLEKARLFEEIRIGRERLQALSRRLLDVQETERRHIARELHDEVGQVLTGVKLLLEMSKSSPVESVDARLEQALALVDELAARVQELSLDLRPAMLDDLGLLPTLAWHFPLYQTDESAGRFQVYRAGETGCTGNRDGRLPHCARGVNERRPPRRRG